MAQGQRQRRQAQLHQKQEQNNKRLSTVGRRVLGGCYSPVVMTVIVRIQKASAVVIVTIAPRSEEKDNADQVHQHPAKRQQHVQPSGFHLRRRQKPRYRIKNNLDDGRGEVGGGALQDVQYGGQTAEGERGKWGGGGGKRRHPSSGCIFSILSPFEYCYL